MLRPAALTLVFLLIAILGARQTGSLDAGHHLQAGRGILVMTARGAVASSNMLPCRAHPGTPTA